MTERERESQSGGGVYGRLKKNMRECLTLCSSHGEREREREGVAPSQ